MEYSLRLKEISPSPTSTLNSKTKELISQGKNIINLSIGEPDFDTPDYIKEAAIKAMNDGITRYTENEGIYALRQAISKKLKYDNQLIYDPSQIVVSNGAKHSLYNVYQALLNQGDEVILQSPYWVSYPEIIKLSGGKPIIIPTGIEHQFKMHPDNIRESITPKTKIIQLNSPSNPTGAVYTKDELIEIGKIAEEYNLFIVSDEIYEKIIYEEKHTSIASLSEELYNRTIIVNGVSKAYAMTGWRIGYIATSKELANIITSFQSHSTSNASSISQMAALAAISGPQNFVENMNRHFIERRNLMYQLLKSIDGTNVHMPQGSFYMFPEISGWMDRLGKESCVEVADWLLQECGVAAIPGAAFGSPGYLRFSFAVSSNEIRQAFEKIKLKLH